MLREFYQMFLYNFKIKYRRKCHRSIIQQHHHRQQHHQHSSTATTTTTATATATTASTTTINYINLIVLFVFCFCTLVATSSKIDGKCTDVTCMNGGVCGNGSCVCADGWQGDECQFCGGKVRLTDSFGTIHDGAGNYSVGVKCSWLIDARDHSSNAVATPASRRTKQPSIRLHLEEFATECGWDHLYVFDGDSVESPLLAVFSGLMYRNKVSIRRVPEVVAHSGSVLLHFFSDDAYNMSGFNISYKINGCPTSNSSLDCSGHGVCVDGACTCDGDYMGTACHVPKCLNNCSFSLGQGECDREAHRCSCYDGFAGSDCTQIASLGYWTTISPKYSSPHGSASHGSAVWGDTLHIIAGESYNQGELLNIYDFNGNVWERVHAKGTNPPESRYSASTVMYGDKIYLYGGVISGGKGVCDELWAFDVSAKTWENITVKSIEKCNATYEMCGPLKSAGHTATLVSGYDSATKINYQYMVVLFGHSPQFGYLNTVQEYTFSTREWKIVQTIGFPVKGGYGHSASYDQLTERIYVYGGIVSESESNQFISSRMYSYDPKMKNWTLLTGATSGRFLHTATFISPGLMMVYGGNTHNDTSHSFGAKCYSKDLLIYDVICDSWNIQQMPDDLRTDLSRFGHSAEMFEKSLYIYGGFDGQMLSDIIKYTPGDCRVLQKMETCLHTRPGLKCVWDTQKSKCLPINEIPKELVRPNDSDAEIYQICPKKSRTVMTSEQLLNTERCSELQDCQSCVSTKFGCTYCGAGVCSKTKCRDALISGGGNVGGNGNNNNNNNNNNGNDDLNGAIADLTSSLSNNNVGGGKSVLFYTPITEYSKCIDDQAPICMQLHSCHACLANGQCHWDYETSKCRVVGNRTAEEPLPCPPSCAALTSCSNCTTEECIWCQNEQRCVDKNAYTSSFPYGQCREWTTITAKCRAAISGGRSQCSFYKTCSQCRDDPACGWCDDGSHTGLGQCLPGGDSGPQEEMECSVHRWHFTHCPSCQCNGHSTCSDGKICKQPCSNLTTGINCERCKSGYWGNPVNGGICQKCECNGQATHCNHETAKCFCSTKGLAGDHCEKCDATNHYHGDPSKGSCYYDLTIDYQFTFNLSKKEDRHFTQINFRNSPSKSDIDADFTISCSVPAKMNITIRTAGGPEKALFVGVNCSNFRYRFSKTEHQFGHEDNVTLTTFYVYVYDFQPPLWIQIAFSQYPKLNLQQFFITFSTCFLLLLLMAAILWKIKQKYDMFRRRQRLFVEMEQMASRPFSQVLVEIENRELLELSPATENITNITKRRKKDSPSPIALEPCNGDRAAVLSLLVRLPTGGLQHSPPGQAAGLAVASTLVTLGNPRPSTIEHPKEPKTKRKQSQHPDSCI